MTVVQAVDARIEDGAVMVSLSNIDLRLSVDLARNLGTMLLAMADAADAPQAAKKMRASK